MCKRAEGFAEKETLRFERFARISRQARVVTSRRSLSNVGFFAGGVFRPVLLELGIADFEIL